jgi:hypothetical protein
MQTNPLMKHHAAWMHVLPGSAADVPLTLLVPASSGV